MYVEPTWVELLIYGAGLNVLSVVGLILVCLGLSHLFSPSLAEKWNIGRNNRGLFKLTVAFFLFLILMIPLSYASGYVWYELMEKPSVREETVTITGIQPLPDVKIDENGYIIDNADQLMFVTSDGREFKNTENWKFNKFDTRSIFNKLKINGTYKIRYYGWRNGHENEFPNILSVERVVDENNTTVNDYNKYFGINRGQNIYGIQHSGTDYGEYGD